MIAARGKPEASANPEVVHFLHAPPAIKSQILRGAKPLKVMCNTQIYHIQYTDEIKSVSCARCRRLIQKHLIEMVGQLDKRHETQAS